MGVRRMYKLRFCEKEHTRGFPQKQGGNGTHHALFPPLLHRTNVRTLPWPKKGFADGNESIILCTDYNCYLYNRKNI